MKKILSVVFCLLLSVPAFSSIVFSPGVSYRTTDTEASQPSAINSEGSETIIDVKLGYVLPMGLYLGGMYSAISGKTAVDNDKGKLIGPSIGYYSPMGFYTFLTYHIIGDLDRGGDTLTGGKGPQLDLGWVFPLSANFAIGPQMTWRSTEFDKRETAGVSVDTDYKTSSLSPYVSLWFMF